MGTTSASPTKGQDPLLCQDHSSQQNTWGYFGTQHSRMCTFLPVSLPSLLLHTGMGWADRPSPPFSSPSHQAHTEMVGRGTPGSPSHTPAEPALSPMGCWSNTSHIPMHLLTGFSPVQWCALVLLGKAHTAAGFDSHFLCQGRQYSTLVSVLQRELCCDRLFSGI